MGGWRGQEWACCDLMCLWPLRGHGETKKIPSGVGFVLRGPLSQHSGGFGRPPRPLGRTGQWRAHYGGLCRLLRSLLGAEQGQGLVARGGGGLAWLAVAFGRNRVEGRQQGAAAIIRETDCVGCKRLVCAILKLKTAIGLWRKNLWWPQISNVRGVVAGSGHWGTKTGEIGRRKCGYRLLRRPKIRGPHQLPKALHGGPLGRGQPVGQHHRAWGNRDK